MKKHIYKKYAKLFIEAQNVTRRNEAVFLIKKAAKLQNKLTLKI